MDLVAPGQEWEGNSRNSSLEAKQKQNNKHKPTAVRKKAHRNDTEESEQLEWNINSDC